MVCLRYPSYVSPNWHPEFTLTCSKNSTVVGRSVQSKISSKKKKIFGQNEREKIIRNISDVLHDNEDEDLLETN